MDWKIIRRRVVRARMFFVRSAGYISTCNSLMLIILVVNSFHWRVSKLGMVLLVVGFALLMGFIGWIEDRLGIHEEEQREYAKRHPLFKDML